MIKRTRSNTTRSRNPVSTPSGRITRKPAKKRKAAKKTASTYFKANKGKNLEQIRGNHRKSFGFPPAPRPKHG